MADLSKIKLNGAVYDLKDAEARASIPTKISDLTNDSGYLTSYTETDPTVPAWAKAANKPSYTAAEVGATTTSDVNSLIATAIGGINQFNTAIVSSLPASNIDTHTIYFISNSGSNPNVYDEYMYINNNWEKIGTTETDLTGYLKDTDIAAWAKASTKPSYTATEVGALPSTTSIPTKVSDLTNDSGFITSYTETDPTVPAWAKTASKPTYTASEVGAMASTHAAAAITSTDISNWNAKSDFSGSYNDLTNKPTIPAATTVTNTLSSGTLIATINGTNVYAPTYTNGDNLSYGGN